MNEFPPEFNPACCSCGRRNLVWSFRHDGAPVGHCLVCDDELICSPNDIQMIRWVKTKNKKTHE